MFTIHYLRGPPTIYRHHKGLRIKKGISKGVVYELSEPKIQPNLHHPQDCTGDVLHGFCRGGARIVGFDIEIHGRMVHESLQSHSHV